MNRKEYILPHPENKSYLEYQEKCNNATNYFIWLEKKQTKYRTLMNRYPLIHKKNRKIISLLKGELKRMDQVINPLRDYGYRTYQAPSFDFQITEPIILLFATQHHANYALNRIRLLEEDYSKCLNNFYKIVDDNKYLYTKNLAVLSIVIAVLSIVIAIFTVFSGIFIETNFNFSVF